MLTYNYYGHACFQLDDGKNKILVDPFLTGNPQASISEKDVEADYILVTHAHGDHVGDAPNIAVRTGATVVGIPEIMDFGGQRVKTIGMNLGGTVKTKFGFVRMVPALGSWRRRGLRLRYSGRRQSHLLRGRHSSFLRHEINRRTRQDRLRAVANRRALHNGCD